MYRYTTSLSFLLAVMFGTAPLSAAQLSVSLGIRQSFPAGDANGDLVIDQADHDIWDEYEGETGPNYAADFNFSGDVGPLDEDTIFDGFGSSTSGIIGSNAGTTGDINSIGGQTLVADGTWQQMTFTFPPNFFFRGSSDWGALEGLRFTNTTDGETQYKVWIDDLANVNASGTTIISDFESFSPGQTGVLFHQPRFSNETVSDLLSDPDLTAISNETAFSGSQSLSMEWEFIDDDPTRQVHLSTMNTTNLPNPLIQLRDGDYSQVPVDGTVSFAQTSVTFWAKATVVPEPNTFLLTMSVLAGFAALRPTNIN